MPRTAGWYDPPTLEDAWQGGTLTLADARNLTGLKRDPRNPRVWKKVPMVLPPEHSGDPTVPDTPERVRPYDATMRIMCPKTKRACRPVHMLNVKAVPNTKIDGAYVDGHWVREHFRDGRVKPSEFLEDMGAPQAAIDYAKAKRDRDPSRVPRRIRTRGGGR